jgi:hypothetical protein
MRSFAERLRDEEDVFDSDSHTMWNGKPGKMMNCKEVVDLLSDYLANELSPEDLAGVRAHLKRCRNCKAFLASLKTTVKLTHNLKADDIPPGVVDSLRTFLKSNFAPNKMPSGPKKIVK